MRYLVIDACLGGTGIRDKYASGYLAPKDFGLSYTTAKHLREWQTRYEEQHYLGFMDEALNSVLDYEGRDIAKLIKLELSDVKLEYFSAARMTITSVYKF